MSASGPATQDNARNYRPIRRKKPEEADGGWRGPKFSPSHSVLFFPRLLRGNRAPNSNFNRTRTSFRLVLRAGLVGVSRTPAGEAVQHEPGSVPAPRPVANEMQRLRGQVRSALPRVRGWRLGSSQGGRWRLQPVGPGLRLGVRQEPPGRGGRPSWDLVATSH